MNLADLRRLLANTNVTAFLRVIRERESSQDESAYTVLNGGARFFSFAAHPYKGQRTPPGKAAGAYQFIASTWGDVEQQYGMPDFSPASQDAGAVARLVYRGALEDVMAGRFEQAVTKCRLEWTSLPGAAESSRSWTMDKALAVFRKWGGRTAAELAALRPGGAPTPTPQPPAKAGQPNQREEARMGGFLAGNFVGELLGTVLQVASSGLRARVEQAASKVTDEAGAKVLVDGLMGVAQQIAGAATPVQAAAALTTGTPEATAKLAEFEKAAMLKLDELAPFLDTIAKLELAGWKATEDSRNAAAARNDNPNGWKLRFEQLKHTQQGQSASLIGVVAIAIVVALVKQDMPGEGIMVLLTALVMANVNTFRDIAGYLWGGVFRSGAADEGLEEVKERRKQGAKP